MRPAPNEPLKEELGLEQDEAMAAGSTKGRAKGKDSNAQRGAR
jgi:hypothetical protein